VTSAEARPTVIVVGLGPGPAALVTNETGDAIARAEHRFVRAAEHPAAVELLPDAIPIAVDDALDGTARYAPIVEALVAAAVEHGEALYAVPGSPLVLEPSVRALQTEGGVEVRVLPALSFLDLAWARLGVDPVAARVALLDAGTLDDDATRADHGGPWLVAHVHDPARLAAARTALDGAADGPVVVLSGLGHSDERIVEMTWASLEHADPPVASRWTCLFVPAVANGRTGGGYLRFHRLARTLREQCPWDRQQTHASLVPYLVEETFELVDALQALDPADPASEQAVVEELGDVLFQIEFHATIAEQAGRFTIDDVTAGVHDKLVRRHPHVFAAVEAADASTVVANWDEIKRAEKQRTSVFDGVATSLPALAYTHHLMRKAAKLGFDWPHVGGPLAKLDEELAELRAAIVSGDADDVGQELGDVLATVVSVARHLGVDPEVALRASAAKFRRRFEALEALAEVRGIDVRSSTLAALDALWDEVKAAEQHR